MAEPTSPTSGAAAAPATTPAFDPTGKNFLQRLEACLADAKTTYSISIRKDQGRTSEWQHKHHVAHMFLYNKYNSVKPAFVEPGGKTIAWDHFSDPSVVWPPAIESDFLRTKTGGVAKKDGNKWKKDEEPDKEKTKANVKQMQIDAKIGNSGEAMVSAGMKPCGEPCKCNAGRSKHLSDQAADLNSADLASLVSKLSAAKAGTIDDYLKKFGLHRPLVNHPESPEEWHVEAIGDTDE